MKEGSENKLWRIAMVFIGCLLLAPAFSQTGKITGRVVDVKDLEPLPFANIFINNTTLGTTTELNGEFTLKNVSQPAVYEIIISFVGYESYKLKVSLEESELRVGTIRLKPSETELTTVEVKGTKDVKWERDLKKFKRIFLGEDKSADLCTIVNPWVIDFPKVEGQAKFMATASAPIQIENKALGYKILFYLINFRTDHVGYLISGNVRFEELGSLDDKERAQWSLNRRKSYLHSRQHLFKAMLDHQINGAGFNLYTEMDGLDPVQTRSSSFNSELGKTVKRYDTLNLISPDTKKDVFRIALKGRVEVHYRNEKPLSRLYRDVFYPVSWIQLKRGFVLVNRNGVELTPAEVTVSGDMSKDRVAHLLPTNYLPEESISVIQEKKEDPLLFLLEKIYVHTDKPYYYPGEALWFKGYINYHSPSLRDSLSRTVYVEIVDSERKFVSLSKTLEIDSGVFHGDFQLPDTMKNGTYYLRAFTSLSRNFGDQNIFMKILPVLKLTDKVNPSQGRMIGKTNDDFTIKADKSKYKTREKITLTLQLKDDEDQPLAANLSIAVTDATQVVPVDISKPITDVYSMKESDLITGNKDLPFPVEYGISFSGRFLDDKNKPTKAILNVIQFNPRNFVITQSDESGKFILSGLVFYDTASFSVQALRRKGELYGKAELLVREGPSIFTISQPQNQLSFATTTLPQRMKYEFSGDSRLLKEIEVKASRIPEEYTIEYRTKRPYGRPNYVLKAKDINTTYGNLLLSLPSKFPGLVVRQSYNLDESPRWVVYLQKNYVGSLVNQPEVVVTINDTFVGGRSGDILGTIDPTTVETVELRTSVNVMYGSAGMGGVLAVYTKQGVGNEEVKITKDTPLMKVIGYSKPGLFRFPNYADPLEDASRADFRSLLYWNPNVTTDPATGAATLSFFASDLDGRYCVVVEGVSKNGLPVRSEYFIDVESR